MGVEILGFLIVIVIMMIVIFRRQSMQSKLKERKNLDDSASQLQLQLEEVADAVIGRMENRIDHLEMLIAEADDKIVRLDDQMKCVAALKEQEALRVEKVVDTQLPALEKIPQELTEAPIAQAMPLPRLSEKKKIAVPLSKANQAVIDLLDGGYSLNEIAKKTGMGKGAILLIQEMYQAQRSTQVK